jgi:hypothetical protein
MPLPDGYLYYLDPQDTATITGTDPVTNIAVKGSAVPEHQFSDMAHGGLQSGGDYNGHNILVCTGVGGIGQPAFTGPSIASTVCVFRLTEDTPASWTWFVYDGNWSNSPTGLRCATGTGLVSTRPTPSSQNEYTERTGVVAPKGKLLVSIDIRNGADSTVYLYDLEDSGAELGSHVLDLSTTPQPTAGPIRLAASVAAGSLHLQGNIGHVFLYPRALDAQERSDIVSWLVEQWALSQDGIVYTLIPNADGTQRTNYPDGDYAPPLYLPAPTNTRLYQITTDSMRLQWDYPSSGTDATGFEIQRWVTGVSTQWDAAGTVGPTVRQSAQGGLPETTLVRFRVRAFNG